MCQSWDKDFPSLRRFLKRFLLYICKIVQSFSTAAVAFGTILCKAALEQYVLLKALEKETKLNGNFLLDPAFNGLKEWIHSTCHCSKVYETRIWVKDRDTACV